MKKLQLKPLELDKETIAQLDINQLLNVVGKGNYHVSGTSSGCGSGGSNCTVNGTSTGCGDGSSTCFAR